MSLSLNQLEARKGAMFSTDAAPALGLSLHSTPVRVWLEKTGRAEPVDLSDNEAVQMGHVMEPIIARLYAERTGHDVRYLGDRTMFSRDIEWMGSHFDYEVVGSHLVECKNFSAMRKRDFGDEGTGDVPMDVLMQVIHEATVYQTDRVDVAVCFGGQELKIFPVEVDEAAKAKLIDLEHEFWEKFVVAGVAPEPRNTEETKQLFRRDTGGTVYADAATVATHTDLRMVRETIAALVLQEDRLKTILQNTLQENSTLMDVTGTILATWKKAKDGSKFDAKTFGEQYPALYAQFLGKTEGSRRFLVKG